MENTQLNRKAYYLVDSETEEDIEKFKTLEEAKEYCENRWIDVTYEGEETLGMDVYSQGEQVGEIEIGINHDSN